MGLIAWIVIGAVVGGIANWIVKGGFGIVGSVIGGIIGAVAAGYLTNMFRGQQDVLSLDLFSIVAAIALSIIVVGVGKVALGKGSD